MHNSDYLLSVHAGERLLTISFTSGCWRAEIADRFRADCYTELGKLRSLPGGHFILVDLRNAVLQTKEVFARFQAHIAASTADKVALVASSPLARMQTKRLQIRDTVRLFDDLPEARAWLFS